MTGCCLWLVLVPLDAGDVSRAWLVWSSAAEAARADAGRLAGGPVPERGLIMGRGTARMRVVRLGGLNVRKARKNAANAPVIHLLHPCLTLGVGRRRSWMCSTR